MIITDMETFLLDYNDRIFGFNIYRRMFTPYENAKKFIDESYYENGTDISYGKIVEAIDLGGGEWLLGFKICWEEDDGWEFSKGVEYYKLSELRLMYNDTHVDFGAN